MSDEQKLPVDSEPTPEPGPQVESVSSDYVTTLPARMTDSQLERIKVVIEELASSGNVIASAGHIALQGKSKEQQRRIVANIFSQTWATIMVIHMAVGSDQKVGDIRRALREIRSGRSSAVEQMDKANHAEQ